MNVLDFSWNTLATITGREYKDLRLILDPSLSRPRIGPESSGFTIKLPVPRAEGKGAYVLQGLYADAEEQNWKMLWRLFRASLYHSALHIVHPPGNTYSVWARDKDWATAIFTVSLLEDYRITTAAKVAWGSLLRDIAFANYIGAERLGNPDKVDSGSLRFACKLLLSLWGVAVSGGERSREDAEALAVAEQARGLVENVIGQNDPASLLRAADLVYSELEGRGHLLHVPSFPHTEAHSGDSLFGPALVEGGNEALMVRAAESLGATTDESSEPQDYGEAEEAFRAFEDDKTRIARIEERYGKLVAATKLKGFEVPTGDYAAFLEAKADLAGSIRNIRNQLMQVKNVLDEEPGKESGQVDVPAAIQIIASTSLRTDAFMRDEPLFKDECWMILLDASKSLRGASIEVRSIAACLAEVAKDLMREGGRWAMIAFNDKLQILKDFDEQYTMDHRARIGGLRQEGPTYLPDALQVAAKALAQRPVEAKFLVVVSDCLPTGYEGIDEELERVVTTLNKTGVLTVGLGIKSTWVKKYFPVSSVLETHYEMMKSFVKAYLELSSSL